MAALTAHRWSRSSPWRASRDPVRCKATCPLTRSRDGTSSLLDQRDASVVVRRSSLEAVGPLGDGDDLAGLDQDRSTADDLRAGRLRGGRGEGLLESPARL